MKRYARYGLLSAALLTMTMLAMSIGQRLSHRGTAWPLREDWDIPEMVDYLGRAGLHMRLQSTRKDGLIDISAYLTTTDKSWEDMCWLSRRPHRIQEWRGTVLCKYAGAKAELILWPTDPCLVAGPFVFFGDPELLERIRAILAPSAPPLALWK